MTKPTVALSTSSLAWVMLTQILDMSGILSSDQKPRRLCHGKSVPGETAPGGDVDDRAFVGGDQLEDFSRIQGEHSRAKLHDEFAAAQVPGVPPICNSEIRGVAHMHAFSPNGQI